MPSLKAFLKEGGVDEYRNVEVEFIHGKKATLYIYEGEEENEDDTVEEIVLSDYKTQEEMHKLLQSRGFERKSEDEIAEIHRQLQRENNNNRVKQQANRQKRKEQQQAALEEAKKKAQGVGVEHIIEQNEEVPELKSFLWKKEQQAAIKAKQEGKKNWKEIAVEKGKEELEKINANRRRRGLMEL